MQTCTNPGSSAVSRQEVKGAIDMNVEKDKNIVKTSVITTSTNLFNTSAVSI